MRLFNYVYRALNQEVIEKSSASFPRRQIVIWVIDARSVCFVVPIGHVNPLGFCFGRNYGLRIRSVRIAGAFGVAEVARANGAAEIRRYIPLEILR